MADSEKYFTKLVDGQLSVATVAQSGEIIPEESRPGDKYTTALVQTDDGPQLCVKTYDLNGGGGGTVDQTYDPTSTNAQSGTAVAEAVAPALKNTATGTNSLTILGTASPQISSVNIGKSSNASGAYSVAIGNSAQCTNQQNTSIGFSSNISAQRGVAIGASATVYNNDGIAIGRATQVSANNAIQLGANGGLLTENTQAKTLQVFEWQLLDGTTGKIPMARLPIVQLTQAEYDALVSGGTVDSNTIYCIIPA